MIKLSHEQAACVRCLFVAPWVHAADLGHRVPPELWANDANNIGQIFDRKRAQQALAEYDARYTTIERAELERLQQQESKLNVILKAFQFNNVDEMIDLVEPAIGAIDAAKTSSGLESAVETYETFGAELERLQALERKIEAFLAQVSPLDYLLSVGSHLEVAWDRTRGVGWCVLKDGIEIAHSMTEGDAMRKAFELFEGPKEKK